MSSSSRTATSKAPRRGRDEGKEERSISTNRQWLGQFCGKTLREFDRRCRRSTAIPGAVYGFDRELDGAAGRFFQSAQMHFYALAGWSGDGDQLARQLATVERYQEPKRAGRANIARGNPGYESLARRQELTLRLDPQIAGCGGWLPIVGTQFDREIRAQSRFWSRL